MATGLPQGVSPGQIYRHPRFYRDANEKWQPKYLMILAAAPGGDIVFRLLTSQSTGRPETPPCHRGDPYPGFFLGVLGPPLGKKSWLDLRKQDDYEGQSFINILKNGTLILTHTLGAAVLCDVLECAAGAQDTTRQQERAIREQRATLDCK